ELTRQPLACKRGFFAPWQLLAIGGPWTLPPALLSIYCLIAILRRTVKDRARTLCLIRAGSANLSPSIRLLIVATAACVITVVYLVKDCLAVYQRTAIISGRGWVLRGLRQDHPALTDPHAYPFDLGDVLAAVLGLGVVIVFATTRNSIRML